MIIFISTQNSNSAAGYFYKNLIKDLTLKPLILNQENKGILNLIRLSIKVRSYYIKNNLKGNKLTLVTDCGWMKTNFIILLGLINPNKMNLYSTYYHHIFNFKECVLFCQLNEFWKYLSLKIYTMFIKLKFLDGINYITVSDFTSSRLKKNFNIPKNRIYILWNHLLKECIKHVEYSKAERIKNDKDKFILMISSLQGRKNIKAIKYIAENYNKKVILICPKPRNNFEKKLIKYLYSKKIHVLHKVKEKTKINLFKRCNCLLIPSLFEGLSLLPLEAIIYNIPMLLSDIKSVK